MRVAMISKACIVGIYQRKLEDIARAGVELLVVVPPAWQDARGFTPLELTYTHGYRMEVLPIVRNGDYHLHFYRGLGPLLNAFRPDILHIDEEPYNLAAWQGHWHARRLGAKSLFFTWQNIVRRYPPPFAWGERWMLNTVDYGIAGTESAAEVWREKGYCGPLAVIPQFGTDPALFHPAPSRPEGPFTIGYLGGLVEEKGLAVLVAACARLTGDWRLLLVGGGAERSALEAQAKALGISDRVSFRGKVPSSDVPAVYHELDVLALPSLTRSNWKEQFGRVLVEAMMSGVPVVGSDSGAIPDVVGDAGLIVPEGDVEALAGALARLQGDAGLRDDLAARGRERSMTRFTQAQVAAATVGVYEKMMGKE